MTRERAERAHAGRAARVAADDGDPHRVVEAAGEDEADQGGASVAGRERKRRRALVRPEQSSPAERLERLGEQQEQPRRHEQAGVSARERPGVVAK